jgi:hypothetical protein
MKTFNVDAVRVETVSAQETIRQAQTERLYRAYIGVDSHNETIVVSVTKCCS